MIPNQKHRRYASRALARLWLALLLAATPVLTFAGGVSVFAADEMTPTRADQAPCHEGGGQSMDSAQQADCQHCAGDGPASQCHCCDFAAPAGLAGLGSGPAGPPQADMPVRLPVSKPLPHSPGEPLYRPPITSA